jgi:poly(3-hydroxybutyrate) depolymerase
VGLLVLGIMPYEAAAPNAIARQETSSAMVEESVGVDGIARSAFIYAPPGLAEDGRVPVVLFFYGDGGNALAGSRHHGFNGRR